MPTYASYILFFFFLVIASFCQNGPNLHEPSLHECTEGKPAETTEKVTRASSPLPCGPEEIGGEEVKTGRIWEDVGSGDEESMDPAGGEDSGDLAGGSANRSPKIAKIRSSEERVRVTKRNPTGGRIVGRQVTWCELSGGEKICRRRFAREGRRRRRW